MGTGKRIGATGVLAAAALVALAPAPASAAPSEGFGKMASVSCHVVTSHCTSSNLTVGSNHTVTYSVHSGGTWNGCSWRVKDVNSGVAVASGRTGAASSDTGSRGNLYGTYRIELWNCSAGAVGSIYN